MDQKSFLISQVAEFKNKYKEFRNLQDYVVFTAMCIKYFYYSAGAANFDAEKIISYLTDGANDGGIDAVFNNEESEDNNLVLVQSKYYNVASISFDKVVGELAKINETVKSLTKYKREGYSEKMVTAYTNAVSEMGDNAHKEIVFFTSYELSNKKERNKISKKVQEYFPEFDVELYFGDDIIAQIDSVENCSEYVENDTLMLDKSNNYLEYEDSIIVNVSARSLQNLYNKRLNKLLGLNLRYHIKDNKVDNAIASTIEEDPNNFWYKNNGILIICEDYERDGKVLKLENFSIVNGGQTTYKIGKADLENTDFYLQCKVVKSKGISENERDNFITKIAEATNSQKPIKVKDLKANAPEQRKLKKEFEKIGIYYIIKNGDKASPSSKYPFPYLVTSLEKVGKVSLAGVLQMPGSSRSNSAKMYDDLYYYNIFGSSASPRFIADLIKIDYYYEKYIKTDLSAYSDETISVIKNGRTFTIACIAFAVKLNKKIFNWEAIKENINNADELKKILRKMDGIECLIENKLDNEQEIFYNIFGLIGEEVLSPCFELAKAKASSDGKVIAPSDYLKSDQNYYKDVLQKFYTKYQTNKELRLNMDNILIKNK